jgi:hypothetical protein
LFSCFVLPNPFGRNRGHGVQFSCFTPPNSFLALPRASGLIFMFFALGLNFGSTEGVGSRFHVFRSRTHFRRYRGRWVPFLCFALPHLFWAVPGCRVPFSCFAQPESFWAVQRALGSIFMFCALGHVFGETEGVGSHFHVLRYRTYYRRY